MSLDYGNAHNEDPDKEACGKLREMDSSLHITKYSFYVITELHVFNF